VGTSGCQLKGIDPAGSPVRFRHAHCNQQTPHSPIKRVRVAFAPTPANALYSRLQPNPIFGSDRNAELLLPGVQGQARQSATADHRTPRSYDSVMSHIPRIKQNDRQPPVHPKPSAARRTISGHPITRTRTVSAKETPDLGSNSAGQGENTALSGAPLLLIVQMGDAFSVRRRWDIHRR